MRRASGASSASFPNDRIIAANALAVAIRDRHPITPLHTLVVPKRHATTFFDLFEPERRSINLLLDTLRGEIIQADSKVAAFNIGMNSGAARQTVDHAHFHLIPSRRGDVENPRCGIRAVVPGKANN
jgi:ATP adenylyltransferase